MECKRAIVKVRIVWYHVQGDSPTHTRAEHRRTMRQFITWIFHPALGCLLLVSCGGTEPILQESTVFFRLNAPLCSMALPVRLSIDGSVVGIDTFRVNLPDPHLTTRGFPTSAGRHVLGAFAFAGVWPDTTVTLRAGIAMTDTLSAYCS